MSMVVFRDPGTEQTEHTVVVSIYITILVDGQVSRGYYPLQKPWVIWHSHEIRASVSSMMFLLEMVILHSYIKLPESTRRVSTKQL